jgi:dTDP-4-amino-4,6-dideoxygalactose transaminase
VIPIHLYGGCADMDPIQEIAGRRGWSVIEDAAQAIGAEYKGTPALSMGDAGCLSFFPSKNLGAMGDAGMMTTSSSELARKLAMLRVHGETRQYHHQWVGTNSRMDNLQAAILRVKLRYLDQWTEQRQINASRYHEHLGPLNLPVTLPSPAPYQTRHVFNQFVIRSEDRDALRARLTKNGVGAQIYYPVPLHMQECFQDLGYVEGDFPESERAAREVLALPVAAPGLSGEDIEYTCDVIRRFYE